MVAPICSGTGGNEPQAFLYAFDLLERKVRTCAPEPNEVRKINGRPADAHPSPFLTEACDRGRLDEIASRVIFRAHICL